MTKCYTFYSYKGGSGRSTTAMNTVKHLIRELGASPDKPILMVDADLESAGLTFFFGLNEHISDIALTTTGILSNASELECLDAFDCFDDSVFPLSDDVQTALNVNLSHYYYLFDDMVFSLREKEIFLTLLEEYNVYKNPKRSALGSKKKEAAEKLIQLYNPVDLVMRLEKIHKDPNKSAREKILEKRYALQKFLPQYTFADLSCFYQCAPGTVRFLGVDVNSDRTKVEDGKGGRGSTEYVMSGPDVLLNACKKKNCAAVIFDCGAGTQSSAHALHAMSDVIVYCMRPTTQFAMGTKSNLKKYKTQLMRASEYNGKSEGQKPVIVLPTAVPKHTESNPLCAESFETLTKIVSNDEMKPLIDTYFCDPEHALGEVALFKWREMILGAKLTEAESQTLSEATRAELQKYEDYDCGKMPEDARQAYETYQALAKRLKENSQDNT